MDEDDGFAMFGNAGGLFVFMVGVVVAVVVVVGLLIEGCKGVGGATAE